MGQKIKILIVDDSQLVRNILKDIFLLDPELAVVGEAVNGEDAVRLTKDLRPDIITMDIQMPVMDGFEATEQIMAYHPTPILILSSAIDKSEQYTSFKAISLGALDNMSKPDITQQGFDDIAAVLVRKVKMLSNIHVIPHIRAKVKTFGEDAEPEAAPLPTPQKAGAECKYRLVAIGASTGGPVALEKLLSRFPADFPIGFVVVQHISKGFIDSLTAWLDTKTGMKVKVARNNEPVEPGAVYFAPDDVQMEVTEKAVIRLQPGLPRWGEFKPAVNHLFHSVGQNLGAAALGVILTGMGEDGAEGMKTMHSAGAHTIAQDRETSLIYGMPRAAIDNRSVRSVLPLEEIPGEILARVEE